MFHITEFAKQKQVNFESHLLAFFENNLDEILLAEPSNCHHPTSNQIGPIHLFLSLSLPTLLYSTPPKPPCPPSTVNLTLKMQIKHRKIISTHIESTCKTIGKLQRCLFMNQI
jgi:hypothetical protein